ncbi:MAG TPA: hypothetical protein VJH92_03730 [Candidatus Nanoarchaeia archaeon]|nr:hypothetical protein [Candidatus Nanoarchaeia archaeon]
MKEVKVSFNYKGKKISVLAGECKGLSMGIGLTWKRRKNARALLFDFKKNSRPALTAMFVFFPFIVLWLDDKNNVIEKRVIRPFQYSIKPKKDFVRVLEIPVNDNYSREVALLDED